MAFAPVPSPCADGSCLVSHIELDDRVGLAPELRAELERALARQGMLADVVRWACEQSPPAELVEVVQQDEYTLDVIVRWRPPAADPVHLVYDTT